MCLFSASVSLLLFCKEIANKNLLIAQGTQCSVVKEIQKEVGYMYTNSLFSVLYSRN